MRVYGDLASGNCLKVKYTADYLGLPYAWIPVDLKKGDTIIKYGEDIGKFVADVEKGGHVHTHNLKTKRW